MTTRFTFTATVPRSAVPDPDAPLDLWEPVPSDGPWQTVTDLHVSAPAPYRIGVEKPYGDRMVYVHVVHPIFPVVLESRFAVVRAEPDASPGIAGHGHEALPPDTAADSLVPVGGRFRAIADKLITGRTTVVDRERALWTSIVSEFHYDYTKSSPRYAMGDSAFVCNYKAGNCSDLHSYLTSLSRSIGIPTVMEFGFPLTGIPVPAELPVDGTVSGYHCWVWFKAGRRWIPADAADARRWQDSGRDDVRDYLFGNLLLPRSAVAVSRGRDIVLVPAQKGPLLNYFIYPYAESAGKAVAAQWRVAYHIVQAPALAKQRRFGLEAGG